LLFTLTTPIHAVDRTMITHTSWSSSMRVKPLHHHHFITIVIIFISTTTTSHLASLHPINRTITTYGTPNVYYWT
jgi:hypothetical protein